NQQHHKPKCLFRILYPLKQTNVHSLSSLTRLSVSKNFMIMDQKKAHTISNFYPPARHFTSILSQRDCKDKRSYDTVQVISYKKCKKYFHHPRQHRHTGFLSEDNMPGLAQGLIFILFLQSIHQATFFS